MAPAEPRAGSRAVAKALSCEATRADGKPCGAPETLVDPETGLCPTHSPGGLERAREAARRGGEATARRLKGKALDADELPALTSSAAAEEWCDIIGRAAVTGRLSHNQAQAGLRAVREWRESHETGAMNDRLDALTNALAEWRKTGDPEPVLELVDAGQ